MMKAKRKSMSVTFMRTGERRYGVRADIAGGQSVQMERASFTAEKRAEIRAEFQRLSERWSSLAVGESFTEPWQIET